MNKDVMDQLNAPLKVHFKPGPGGRKYKFVEGKDVIARLNAAFGHEWSSKVIDSFKDDNQVIVLLELTAGNTTHQGYGGSEIALYKDGYKKGQSVDISNSFKAAFTNALKKAAEQFGIGLESDEPVAEVKREEAPRYENKQPAANQTPVNQPVEAHTHVATTPFPPDAFKERADPPVDVKALAAKALERMQSSGDQANNSGYNPQEVRIKEEANPFKASGEADSPINEIQINAIKGMLLMKKVPAESFLKTALPDSNKTNIEQLTKNEARVVIQSLNTLKSNG